MQSVKSVDPTSTEKIHFAMKEYLRTQFHKKMHERSSRIKNSRIFNTFATSYNQQLTMPKNKNAVIRYMFLDQLLSDQKHQYTCLDLVIKCNDMLEQAGYPGICGCHVRSRDDVNATNSDEFRSGKRLIQMDLQALQDSPFNMEIDSSEKSYGSPIYRYKDQTRTLFSKQLSDDEKRLLKEVLNTLGQFSGVDSFSWLQDLREKLEDKHSFGDSYFDIEGKDVIDNRTIIAFEENKYLRNKEYLSRLFSFISNNQTITISYKKFTETETKKYTVYPYMLKQYSNRWYLICTPVVDETGAYNPGLVLNLPLDRFAGEIKADKRHKFKECAVELEERYEEIIGITYYSENPVDEIIFVVKESAVPFIETKPIHETQRACLDMQYHVEGYKTFCIECRYNHELLSTLSSYGEEIIILSPVHLREKMLHRLEEQLMGYKKTKNIIREK